MCALHPCQKNQKEKRERLQRKKKDVQIREEGSNCMLTFILAVEPLFIRVRNKAAKMAREL
jgi:hypothetical protein